MSKNFSCTFDNSIPRQRERALGYALYALDIDDAAQIGIVIYPIPYMRDTLRLKDPYIIHIYEKPMTLSRVLKTQWPEPMATDDPKSWPRDVRIDGLLCYCVGASLVQLHRAATWPEFPLHRGRYFPAPSAIREAIEWINPNLDPALASGFTLRIIDANDKENFQEAWRLIDKAVVS